MAKTKTDKLLGNLKSPGNIGRKNSNQLTMAFVVNCFIAIFTNIGCS